MTDIGILPTKTGVRVNSSTGRHGDIPAVEESLAGVMTPALLKILNELDRWKRGIESGNDGSRAETDVITRKELQEEISRVVKSAQLAPALYQVPAGMAPEYADTTLAPRVDAVERRMSALEGNAQQNAETLSTRLQAVEQSARRTGSPSLTSGEIEKLVQSLVRAELALSRPEVGKDYGPELTILKAKLDDLAKVVVHFAGTEQAQGGEADQPVLARITMMIEAMADLQNRLVKVETVMATLKMLAEHRAKQEEFA